MRFIRKFIRKIVALAYRNPTVRRIYEFVFPTKLREAVRRLLFGVKKGLTSDPALEGELPAAYDVLLFSIIDWQVRYQRPQQIATHLAKRGHRVFYISATRVNPSNEPGAYQITEVAPQVYQVVLALEEPYPSMSVYQRVIDPDTQEAFHRSIDRLRKDRQIHAAVSLVHLSFWTPLVLDLRERFDWRILYDCMDEWEDFPNITPALLEAERQLVRESDLISVTAQVLYDKWQPLNGRCVLVRNGVDFDFFNSAVHPNHLLSGIPHPIIGFYGGIAEWINLDLIATVAQKRPEWQIVLIGDATVDISELVALPNVHFYSLRPYEEMPLFLYHFDVCMIPFKVNEITHAVDPVKFYEFLSAGKPVVAPRLDELRHYEQYAYLAEGDDDFLSKLDTALDEADLDRIQKRVELAARNTWDARVQLIDEHLAAQTARVSIIIVTYQNVELTRQCVTSIIRSTTYPDYEIILVDNASSDGTRTYLKYLMRTEPRVKVILNNENRGFAAANNQGIKIAEGDVLLLLNNDTVVPRGWLWRLVRYLDDKGIGLVGPVSNFVGNEARIDVPYETLTGMEAFAARYMYLKEGQHFDIKMLAMFCIAMRRDFIDEIGLLDEQFGIGMFEDDDYSERAKAAGYRVVCAEDVFVHHYGQSAFKLLLESGEYQDVWDKNQAYFEEKWGREWEAHQGRQAAE